MSLIPRLKSLLYYQTVKVVEIQNWKLGLLHYSILIAILGYVIGYSIIYSKGYQGNSPIIGATNIKLKGSSYFTDPSDNSTVVWDVYDIVFPPKEDNAVFLTTNFHVTRKQQRGVCLGNDPSTEACKKDTDCGTLRETLNGYTNGTCDTAAGFCFIDGWCDPEVDVPAIEATHLQNVENFSIFVRVSIEFTKYNVNRDNANGEVVGGKEVPIYGYNLFNVSDILKQTGYSYKDIATYGAIFAVEIQWNCNLDRSESECNPEFKFRRIDNPKSKFSPGYNFRYTKEYYLQGEDGELELARDLYKVYGARIVFLISGEGAKFDIIPLLVNLGSGIALLSAATVISDILVLYIIPRHDFYKKNKYQEVEDATRRGTLREYDEEEETPLKVAA